MRMESVTLFRQSATAWPGGRTVHVLDQRLGFMLVSPTPCHTALAEILAEQVTVDRDALTKRDPAELVIRGYCRHCVGTLGSSDLSAKSLSVRNPHAQARPQKPTS
jgi:hypothetical protein